MCGAAGERFCRSVEVYQCGEVSGVESAVDEDESSREVQPLSAFSTALDCEDAMD